MRFGFKTGKEKTQKEVADELRNFTKLYFQIRKKDNRKNEKRNQQQNRLIKLKHKKTKFGNTLIKCF